MLVERELVSVVVPIYNVEEYLHRCIDSIIKQSYSKLEIILVNDGSTDMSGDICDRYKEIDKRVKVIYKDNGGALSARKEGTELATGSYILNLDSDDWIENNMIEDLLSLAIESGADMVSSGIYRDTEKTSTKRNDNLEEGIYREKPQLDYLYSNLLCCGSVSKQGILANLVTKLIKTELLRKVYSQMNETLIWGEDLATVCLCCIEAKKIYITHKAYYHYVTRQGSVMTTRRSNFLVEIRDFYDFMKKKLIDLEIGQCLLKQIELIITDVLVIAINQYMGMGEHIHIPYYIINSHSILPHEKVVLYGAGSVGQDYYKQIVLDNKFKIVKWVDKQFQKYKEKNLNVEPVESIINIEYDYILIAIKSKEASQKIKEQLINIYEIDASKIKWIEPINLIDKYCFNI